MEADILPEAKGVYQAIGRDFPLSGKSRNKLPRLRMPIYQRVIHQAQRDGQFR